MTGYRYSLTALLALALSGPAVRAADEALLAAGKRSFAKCQLCHTIEADGPNRIGPNLYGMFARPPASAPGFRYSAAMKAKAGGGLVWDDATLDAYIASPKAIVPGGSMAFAGIAKADERAALLAYLKSVLGSADGN